MMQKTLVLFLFLFFQLFSAQNQETQGLLMQSEEFRLNRLFKESINTLHLALKNSKNEYDEAKTYAFYSRTYASMDSLAVSKRYAEKSLSVAKTPSSKAYSYYAKATLENYLDNNDLVFKNVNTALEHLKDEKKEDWLKSKLYYLEYQVYSNINSLEKAKASAEKSLHYAEIQNDYNLIASALQGNSSVFGSLHEKNNHKEDLEQAKQFLFKAIEISKKGKVSDFLMAIIFNNLANLEQKHDPKNFSKNGIEYLEKAKYFAEKSGNQNVIGSVYGMESHIAIEQNNYEKAEKLLLQSYQIVESQSSPNYYILYNISKDLVNVYRLSNQFEKALNFSEIAEKNKSLLDEKSNQFNIQKLEIANEIKEKDQKIEYLKIKNILGYLYLGVAVILLILLFLALRNRRYKINLAKSREELLMKEKEEAKLLTELKEKEKQEAELKFKIEQEENQRITAEKNLAELEKDSLKKALMVGTLQIEQKNLMLKEIDEKLSKGERFDLKKMLKKELQNYHDLDNIKTQLQNIHPEFFNRLQEKATKKLTDLDLRFCAYKLIKLETKQIANLLNIDPKSVRMSKYRIKQKFSLPENEDLDDFLESMSKSL